MALTLAEYKKQSQDPLLSGVVQTYINNAPFLNWISYTNFSGGAVTLNRQKTLPNAGFRAIGVPYTATAGEIEPVTESLTIAGGKIVVDRALLKMYGTDRLATEQEMQVAALARTLSLTFFKGDGTGDSFTGLQVRATNVINNGDAALSLSNLLRAVVQCKGTNKVIFVGLEMYLKLSNAKNDSTLGSQINIVPDEFGMPITYFAGVPVVQAGEDVAGDEILDFSEANSTTSIYVVAFDSNGVNGMQNGGLETYRPKTESVASEYDIEWLQNFIIGNPASLQRISGITNAEVVK